MTGKPRPAAAFTLRQTGLDGVVEIVPALREDHRGQFAATFNQDAFAAHGLPTDWVQENQSLSRQKGVLRGLHYQRPPLAQDKLIRVVRGAILDVAVDIRRGSPSFGKWTSLEVSAAKWNQLLVPKGFAHGFLTLEADTEVVYKVSQFYSPQHDAAIRFDDPEIGVDWQLGDLAPVLSDKDANAPRLRDQDCGFVYSTGGNPA